MEATLPMALIIPFAPKGRTLAFGEIWIFQKFEFFSVTDSRQTLAFGPGLLDNGCSGS